ncbi:MAG: hypothetical protein ACT4OZ_10265 [Gemmatimonadota bacterium]
MFPITLLPQARSLSRASVPWSDLRNVLRGLVRQLAGELQEGLAVLARNDVGRALGFRQQVIGRLQRLYRLDREIVEPWADQWLRSNAPQCCP